MNVRWEQWLDRLQVVAFEHWIHITEVGVLILAAWVGYRQLKLLRRQMQDQHLKARRDRALEYSLARSQHLRQVRTAVDEAFSPGRWNGKTIPLGELHKVLSANPGLQTQLITLLAHWENLALTVYAGVTDEDMAREMVASTLVEYVQRFGEFIEERQENEHDRLYVYLVLLARRWREQLAKRGDRPAFV